MSKRLLLHSKDISDDFPDGGFLRLDDFVGRGKAIPISRSTWYAMVRAQKAPAPIALGPRISAYSVESVRAFIESFQKGAGER
ncbi:helix-turn-helix transcriptional regulator [Neorhizobium galegae]|uniref:Uncharacterized protein n=1 Tax=Neorhizobium galegae bv. officinalis TaxID=323656 RepID=A0A0T7GAS1_NEOGA|nr:hypothetical protein [Neorhizobium galegae]CDZ44276.1 Hypothetical protein NGAL_HAMBI1189_02710 [Neorhizobium galegae bv. officinalis]